LVYEGFVAIPHDAKNLTDINKYFDLSKSMLSKNKAAKTKSVR